MTATAAPLNVGRFRAVIERCLGLRFDDSRTGLLAEVLERLAWEDGGAESYLSRLERPNPPRDEIRALAQELTIGETYFFRNIAQFHAFTEVAIREALASRAATRRLRILSAGCASGEEAYSLAISVREHVMDPSWDISITGIDVNTASLEKASLAHYSPWSLRETPAYVAQRWFRPAGRGHALDPSIRAAVRFQERNLAEDEPGFWFPEAFDIIFCRNVLMYFVPEVARAVVARMNRALAPGGYLFLGHAETMRGISDDFLLCHTHGTFYYQRPVKGGVSTREGASSRASGAPARESSAPVRDSGLSPRGGLPREAPTSDWDSRPSPNLDDAGGTSWVDAVQRSSDRIRLLSERPESPHDPGGPQGPATALRRPDVTGALELLAKERFADALELLNEPAHPSGRDTDVLLLRAVLLTHTGQLDLAEAVCAELCNLNQRNAGAHYLLALCHEARGDQRAARQHDEAAAEIDPRFAMPRLHLGLLARRGGDMSTARRELENAMVLLALEDTSRILLYGGGFTRETLVQLCRAELLATGGQP